MKAIFEEYGKAILAVIVGVLLFALIFGGIQLYRVMGEGADVETVLNHSESEQVVKAASERIAPVISVPDTKKLHLYINEMFNPVATVSCVDNEGAEVNVSVEKIVFIDSEGSKLDITSNYVPGTDELNLSTALQKTGVLSVTFQAVDGYNVKTIKTISYVVDAVNS